MPLVISNTLYQNILKWLWNDSFANDDPTRLATGSWKSTQRGTNGTPHQVKI